MVHSTRSIAALVVAIVVGLPSIAAAGPRADADNFEAYFPMGDGTTVLHADVLRPQNLPMDARTPVIMTVSPYFIRAPITPDGGASDPTDTGPSERFYDFLDLTRILDRGYTYVMVDLPGFGGSSGCNDWGGFREQRAVQAAVEWAASQPWSNGRVGLLGKSYDAWTGLMGIARQPKGLKAVVAMEPVFSGYGYLYERGVRFPNSIGTPLIFQGLDAQPAYPTNPPEYQLNGAPQFWCYGVNLAMQQQDEANVPYWMERDLLPPTIGKRTPLFLTQGFLERNTLPDAAFDFLNGLAGPRRAWFGQFDHVRGWEKAEKRFQTGRSTFVNELLRFLDRYVKGVSAAKAPVHRDAPVAVQDNLGRYRAESRWPPTDAAMWWSDLNAGAYTDDGENVGTGSNGGRGVWSVSQQLPHDVHMAGEPDLKVSVESLAPRTNLVGNVYDVAPNGRATLISRGATLLRGIGPQRAAIELYGQDWVVRKGHRLGVLVSGANAEWWSHVPTRTPVTVTSAKIGLPFLRHRRTAFLDGKVTLRLEEHRKNGFVIVPAATMRDGRRTFRLPPALA
jgi:predicted acyl esterase